MRLLQGYAGASAIPSASRALTNVPRPMDKPCNSVQIDQSVTEK
jgi:hypothetical protein